MEFHKNPGARRESASEPARCELFFTTPLFGNVSTGLPLCHLRLRRACLRLERASVRRLLTRETGGSFRVGKRFGRMLDASCGQNFGSCTRRPSQPRAHRRCRPESADPVLIAPLQIPSSPRGRRLPRFASQRLFICPATNGLSPADYIAWRYSYQKGRFFMISTIKEWGEVAARRIG